MINPCCIVSGPARFSIEQYCREFGYCAEDTLLTLYVQDCKYCCNKQTPAYILSKPPLRHIAKRPNADKLIRLAHEPPAQNYIVTVLFDLHDRPRPPSFLGLHMARLPNTRNRNALVSGRVAERSNQGIAILSRTFSTRY